MATHVYNATSVTYIPGPADPLVTIVGTVDGTPVTVQAWLSALVHAYQVGGVSAAQSLVAALMLAAAVIVSPPAPVVVTQLPTGTWTQ
jgi:hypothetical protein